MIFNSRAKNIKEILDKKIEEIYAFKIGEIKKDYIWLNISGKIDKKNFKTPKFKYFCSKI